ncbi:MAG: ATP-grasp domain-containing protein [Thermodesulfobacteriota bacterium]
MTVERRAIGIAYNEPVLTGHPFSEASLDVLSQVEAVETALGNTGISSVRIPFTKDVGLFIQRVYKEEIGMIFNLCETVDEDPRFAGHPASVMELIGIPFSGSPSIALMLTADKLLTKQLLKAEGIRTPIYRFYDSMTSFFPHTLRYPVIVKPRFQEASIGIDQDSIFADEGQLRKGLPEFYERFGPVLVEEYIEGREFNVSLLGYPLARVLPIAEIDFSNFPESLYSIVGYHAKWDIESFEYHNTPRRFPEVLPHGLMSKIEKVALGCFRVFMLRDYGRIDIRVDSKGKTYVLEVNANPCLSPDAGFAAAIDKAGMTYSDFIKDLLDFMTERAPKYVYQTPCLSG